MKTGNYTTKINLMATLLVAFFILLSGCKKSTLLQPAGLETSKKPTTTTVSPGTAFSSEIVSDLMASDELGMTKIGTVVIKNHAPGIVSVTYTVIEPLRINSVRFYTGSSSQIPVNSEGIADPNHFPYRQNLPLGGLSSTTLYVSKTAIIGCRTACAQAIIYNAETNSVEESAWGMGTKISASDWAMYYNYCMDDHRPDVAID